MLDLNRIQSNPEELKEMLKKRCMDDTTLVDKLNQIIQNKKKYQSEAENLRAERNKVSKEIGILKSKGGDIQAISASMKEVGNKIKELEDLLEVEENNLSELNLNLPNFLDAEVPFGKSEEDRMKQH
jgi:seryl-tRNA synthetase